MCPTHSPPGPLELELPAAPTSVTTARHAIADFCAGHALDHEAVALAVSEAVANTVVHAYLDRDPGLVYVSASLDDGALTVMISDDGQGMTPRPDSRGMGIGLALIANVTDSMHIDHDDGGTRLTMRFA
jgi:serine/threonine-protein kinase RsbW/stage II sporulation protein AB (anti-sigma F factor)